jgi:hypothetical protein
VEAEVAAAGTVGSEEGEEEEEEEEEEEVVVEELEQSGATETEPTDDSADVTVDTPEE